MKILKKSHLTIGLQAAALALIDQLLKWFAESHFQPAINLTSWFSLRYEKNPGIAWSIPVPYSLLLIINVILLILLPLFIAKNLDIRTGKAQLFLSFIIGGALGNLIDRLTRGYVIDYISVGSFPVFNLADALLTIGIFLIIVFYGKIKRVHH